MPGHKPLRPLWRDPRPDLAADSNLWDNLLVYAGIAEKERERAGTHPSSGGSVMGLLHGLRCAGATLVQNYNGLLRLNLKALYVENGGDWERADLLERWVNPEMPAIVDTLNRTARGLTLRR